MPKPKRRPKGKSPQQKAVDTRARNRRAAEALARKRSRAAKKGWQTRKSKAADVPRVPRASDPVTRFRDFERESGMKLLRGRYLVARTRWLKPQTSGYQALSRALEPAVGIHRVRVADYTRGGKLIRGYVRTRIDAGSVGRFESYSFDLEMKWLRGGEAESEEVTGIGLPRLQDIDVAAGEHVEDVFRRVVRGIARRKVHATIDEKFKKGSPGKKNKKESDSDLRRRIDRVRRFRFRVRLYREV